MNKFLSFVSMGVLLISATSTMYAKKLTPDEALDRAFSEKEAPSKLRSQGGGMTLAKAINTPGGDAEALYVFEKTGGKGFMILSADDALPAVLGYSDENKIDIDNPSPGFAWLLGQFASQVDYARENGICLATRAEGDDKYPVEPLLTSKWDQNAPYNNYAPTVTTSGVRRSASGCVATALAQVMYYYKYPAVGTGSATATWTGGEVTADLADYPFDWDNMLDIYVDGEYTDQQAKAVADLMYACGLAVESKYSNTTTTASVKDVKALCENFGYSKEMRYYYRDYIASAGEWENLVYESLSRQCPVIYAGGGEDGSGHSFVCDGYQGDGYYHFNWGWSGDSDGYYLLDMLNPKSQGTGGSGGDYNERQFIITDIHPAAEGETFEYQHPIFFYRGNLVFNDGKKFNGTGNSEGKQNGFYNRSPYPVEFFWGIYVIDESDNGKFIFKQSDTYAYGKGVSGMTFSTLGADLGDGVYRIYPMYYTADDDTLTNIYHEVGTNDYLIFTIENDEIVSVEPGYNESVDPGAVAAISDNGLRIIADSQTGGIRIEGVSAPTDVNIFTLTGESALLSQRMASDSAIDISSLSEGVYIVVASNRSGIYTLKFRKK